MNGHDYIANTRLTTLGDVEMAAAGDRCDRVPAQSLPWLLEQGLISHAPVATAAPTTSATAMSAGQEDHDSETGGAA